MRVQITTTSLDTEYLNASVSSDIAKTEQNQLIVLRQQKISASSRIEYQNIIVSIIEDPKIIGVIYSS